MTKLQDQILRIIQQNADKKIALLANQYVKASPDEKEAIQAEADTYYGHYYERPGLYYYDPLYSFWYPRSYYSYWDYPRRYYDDYYYYRDYGYDYGYGYVPQRKPEVKRRDASGISRAPRPERKRGSVMMEDEEKDRSNREIQSRSGTMDKSRRPAGRRSPATGPRKRSVRREPQDEE